MTFVLFFHALMFYLVNCPDSCLALHSYLHIAVVVVVAQVVVEILWQNSRDFLQLCFPKFDSIPADCTESLVTEGWYFC